MEYIPKTILMMMMLKLLQLIQFTSVGAINGPNNDQGESDEKVLYIETQPGISSNFVENFRELSDTINSA